MRLNRCVHAILALLVALALSACSGGASLSAVLQKQGVTEKSAPKMKVEIRFLSESKGSNYKSADVSGDASFLGQLVGLMKSAKPAHTPEGQYTPELRSDYEIVFTDGSGKAVSFFYASKDNYLIYPDSTKDKSGLTLEYSYYTPDKKLASLIAAQKKNAELNQSNDVKPFRSIEQLKSTIDPDDLSEAGADIDFEFFTDDTPSYSGTACRIYSNDDFPSIPKGNYLITAYSKSKSGQQEKLSITGMASNSNYTIITVEEPDDSSGTRDDGQDAPPSYAITVNMTAIDPNKWIVFVDDSGNILDIILPEDIGAVSPAQPSASVSPSGTPAPTEEPPEGGQSATPTDDGSADND